MKSTLERLLLWSYFALILLMFLGAIGLSRASDTIDGSPLIAASFIAYSLVPGAFASMGGLIVTRQPGNVIGWLSMLLALLISLETLVNITLSLVPVLPADPPLFLYGAAWYTSTAWLANMVVLFFIILFFPTGKVPSPRWRWVVLYGVAITFPPIVLDTFGPSWQPTEVDWALQNPLALAPIAALEPIGIYFVLLLHTVLAFLCVLSLFLRYRRSGILERQQIKWFLYACGLFVFITIPLIFARLLIASAGLIINLSNLMFSLSVLTFPLAIGIAILRYRLFDIDLIIRRTILYALLTGLLASIYFGTVIVLQSLLGQATGEQSPLVIILSTLLIAALFNPLRRRLQAFIDRRFYRQKYDAQRVLARFAQTARDETNVEALSAEMMRVIQERDHAPGAGRSVVEKMRFVTVGRRLPAIMLE